MARTLPQLGQERIKELEAAWREPQQDWARKRLLTIRLIALHQHKAKEICQMAGVSRATLFSYLEEFRQGGVSQLLQRGYGVGRPATMSAELQAELVEKLKVGEFRRAKEVQAWILKRTHKRLALRTLYYWLGKVGGVLKMPRKTHLKKDAAQVEAFRREAAERMAKLVSNPSQKVRVWVADEHRYGLLPVVRRCWGLRGVRITTPYLTKYQWGYLYEAMEVDGENKIELLFAPRVGKDVSKAFLEQISQLDLEALHVVIWDQAGFHPRDGELIVPANVRLVSLPAYSPELNPVEQLGDMVKDAICNKVFGCLDSLEKAILEELQPLRESAHRVQQLLGEHSIVASVNACDRF
jgi:transposase